MAKILAESLQEFRSSKENQEELNEAFQIGKDFRQKFLKAGHAMAKGGKEQNLKTMFAWLKKLASMEWPKEAVIKQKLGDGGFKKLQAANAYMAKQLPSFGATPGGATQSGKGGDIGKDDASRLAVVANALGIEAEELKGLLTK